MRPLRLVAQAFGPFLSRIEIPFENLGSSNIYLISGVTGAGKTTIFDAICFALFNTSCGSNRGNTSLRSHFASDDIESFVEFEFLFNGERYKIIRYPSFERKKIRKEGYIIEPIRAVLFLPDGKIIEKVKDVDEYIENLLGLNVSQFSQIALLAQGEFLKLLNSDTQNRAEVFRNIFKTWNYSIFQEKLKQKSIFYKNEFENIKKSILQYIFDIVPIASDVKDLKEKYCSNMYFDDLNLLIKLLDNQNIDDEKKIIKIQEQINDFERKNKNLHEEFLKIQNKINLLNQKEIFSNEIKSLKPEFLVIEKEYLNIETKKNELEKVTLKLQKAQDDYQKVVQINKIKELNKNLENDLKEKYEDLEKVYFELLFVIINYIKNSLQKIKTAKADLFKNQNELSEFKELSSLKNNLYQDVFMEYLNIQAGIIASKLEDGKPCPVCGSKKHPKPAELSNKDLTKEYVDSLKDEVDKINKKAFEASKKCSLINENILVYENEFNKIIKRYNAIYDDDIKDGLFIEYEDFISQLENKIDDIYADLSNIFSNVKNNDTKILTLGADIKAFDESKIIKKYNDLLEKSQNIKEKINKIEKKYFELNNKINGLNSNISLVEKQLEELSCVDIQRYDEISKINKIHAQELLKLNDDFQEINVRKTINQKLLKSIKDSNEKYENISKLYADYKILSDCANGNIANSQKITFEQYIQAYYLDMVLFEANKRLMSMTKNQFQLIRKKDVSSLQTKMALDIEVIDFHTFKKRSTKTLSGGESFKASLALALGLSDCVSNLSGAMNIDSLFIDEGFGSLDVESIELALKVIFELAQNRLIGIISHIEDLKEKVQNQIQVIKTDFGSELEIKF